MNFSYDEADRMLEHLHIMLHDEAKNLNDRKETMQLLQIYALLKIADEVHTVGAILDDIHTQIGKK